LLICKAAHLFRRFSVEATIVTANTHVPRFDAKELSSATLACDEGRLESDIFFHSPRSQLECHLLVRRSVSRSYWRPSKSMTEWAPVLACILGLIPYTSLKCRSIHCDSQACDSGTLYPHSPDIVARPAYPAMQHGSDSRGLGANGGRCCSFYPTHDHGETLPHDCVQHGDFQAQG